MAEGTGTVLRSMWSLLNDGGVEFWKFRIADGPYKRDWPPTPHASPSLRPKTPRRRLGYGRFLVLSWQPVSFSYRGPCLG